MKSQKSTRRELEKIQLKFQISANDFHSQQIIGELKNQIKFMDDMKVRIKAKVKWMEKGDWGSKLFFKTIGD